MPSSKVEDSIGNIQSLVVFQDFTSKSLNLGILPRRQPLFNIAEPINVAYCASKIEIF